MTAQTSLAQASLAEPSSLKGASQKGESPQSAEQGQETQKTSQEPVHKILMHTRERAGYSLRDVAGILRIRYVYLQAIEQGDFRRLPGKVYAIGFIRTYATFLQLDADEMVKNFKWQHVGQANLASELAMPVSPGPTKLPMNAMIALALVLAAALYALWYFYLRDKLADMQLGNEIAVAIDSNPSESSTPVEGNNQISLADAAQNRIENEGYFATPNGQEANSATVVQPQSSESALSNLSSSALPGSETENGNNLSAADSLSSESSSAPGESANPPAVLSVPENSGRNPLIQNTDQNAGGQAGSENQQALGQASVAISQRNTDDSAGALTGNGLEGQGSTTERQAAQGAENIASESPESGVETASAALPFNVAEEGIVIYAADRSWIQIRNGRGEMVLSRLLEPGQVYNLPANAQNYSMITGNAGGTQVYLNGVLLGSLGQDREVREGITLEPAALRQVFSQ